MRHSQFCAHILCSQDGKNAPLAEYRTTESVNSSGKPVISCFIPAVAGDFFKCKFWYTGRGRFPFSALFVRDGEMIAHLAILSNIAGEVRGWEDDKGDVWYMQFRFFEALGASPKLPILQYSLYSFPSVTARAGENEKSQKVPGSIGQLELTIRHYDEDDEKSKVDARPFDVKIKKEEEELQRTKDLEWEGQQTGRGDENHVPFIDWRDPKPRQTHSTAEMVSHDGKVWRQPQWEVLDLGKPEVATEYDNSTIVIFKFYYSSLEYIMTMPSCPSPDPPRYNNTSRRLSTGVVGSPGPSGSCCAPAPPVRAGATHRAAREDSLISRASRLSVLPEDDKKEEQRKIWREMEARHRAEREALTAIMRAQLGYLEGDKGHPIDIDDD